jgi:hypothetical protein
MSQTTPYDVLLAQIWKEAISTLLSTIRVEEDRLTLPATWAASALLEAGLSSRESPIRDYLVRLNNWTKKLETTDGLLGESSTGLLGLWLYLQHQQRKRIKGQLENLFLRSVEHNLQKRKDLSLGRNVKLLNAVAAGLGCISKSQELRAEVSKCLQELTQNTNALETVQILRSWELLQRTDDIPRLDVQHRFESIATDESNPIVERAMAYYGQLRMVELFDKPSIEYEMRFLGCLAVVASSDQTGSGSKIEAYVLSLPYLRLKTSYGSLFDAWQRYVDARLRHAQAENYLFRYLGLLIIAGFGAYSVAWSWFLHLDLAKQVPLAIAVVSLVLAASYFTAQKVLALYGRQFWERSDVKLSFAVMEAILSVVATAALALAQ